MSDFNKYKALHHKYSLLAGASILLVFSMPSASYALDDGNLPAGGVVVGGEALLDYAVPNELHVHQSSNRAVIDWESFNIGTGAFARFHQPSSSSLVVNRVTGGGDPTRILGRLQANGKIMVLDRNGVFFGAGSQVDVGSIVVSTGHVTLGNAMNGDVLNIQGISPGSFIVNEGAITVADAGIAAFVAPTVINNGIIQARLGHIDIGAGSSATIDLYGDGLVELALDKGVLQTLINTGVLNADDGTIRIRAAAARDMVDNVVNNEGIIAAESVSTDAKGRIVLHAGGANKTNAQGISVTRNTGYISAKGRDAGEQGGSIDILGDTVVIGLGSLIDASGDTGGGSIRIGGDYLGTGDTPRSLYTHVDQNALILNDAITTGNGGRTIVWSDHTTDFHGTVFARGGARSGDGGFVETSGKINLLADGYVDLSAINGSKGSYLLDPANITIYGDFAPTDISGLRLWLDPSDQSTLFSDLAGNNPINNGGSVALWKDKSGNNFSISNGSAGQRPTWYSSSQNNLGIVSYDGNDRLAGLLNLLSGSNNFTFLASFIPDATQITYADIFDFNHPGGGFVLQQHFNDLNAYAFAYRSGNFYPNYDLVHSVQSITAVPNIISGLKNGSTSSLFLNGLNKYSESGLPVNVDSSNATDVFVLGDFANGGREFTGDYLDTLIYNTDLEASELALMNQYLSAKWNIGLDPLAGAGSEASEAMDAADGYGAFTTRYLERLSATADIVLQATNSIVLDLKGDVLTLGNNRNITLNTTYGDISTASAGSIVTNRIGTGGNITFNAGDDIDFNHAFALNAQNGGSIALNAGGDVAAPAGLTIANGDLAVDAQMISGIYDGKNAIMNSNAGEINATTSFDILDISGAGATLLPGRIGAAGPATQEMANRIKINGISGTGDPDHQYASFNIGYVAPLPPAANPTTLLEKISSVIQQAAGESLSSVKSEQEDEIANGSDGKAEGGSSISGVSANCLISVEGAGCVVK